MDRRTFMKAGASATLAAAYRPSFAQGSKTLTFIPYADLGSFDPLWSTTGLTQWFSLAVRDTLFGQDETYQPKPQMLENVSTTSDGLTWTFTLRDGLMFHDGKPVLGADCVASITRFVAMDIVGKKLGACMEKLSAASDKVIKITLKEPFPLLPYALSSYTAAIMPESDAKVGPTAEVKSTIGSGPFKYNAGERVSGARVVFERFEGYVPRKDGEPSYSAGPKIAYFDRVVWQTPTDPATSVAALQNGEIDWLYLPPSDFIPSLKKDSKIQLKTIEPGLLPSLQFNHLNPPFDKVEIRRMVLEAVKPKVFMEAVAGAAMEYTKFPVGVAANGTPFATQKGLEIAGSRSDYDALKKELTAAGYDDKPIVFIASSSEPRHTLSLVAADLLKKIGFNVDLQTMDFGTLQQRVSKTEGWNITTEVFAGAGLVFPAQAAWLQENGRDGFHGWPTDPKMQALRQEFFATSDLEKQKAVVARMQAEFLDTVPYVNLGLLQTPNAFRADLTGIRYGCPQFYGIRRA